MIVLLPMDDAGRQQQDGSLLTNARLLHYLSFLLFFPPFVCTLFHAEGTIEQRLG